MDDCVGLNWKGVGFFIVIGVVGMSCVGLGGYAIVIRCAALGFILGM